MTRAREAAAEWWREGYGHDVDAWTTDPEFFRALVDLAPDGQVPYVGTTLMEDMGVMEGGAAVARALSLLTVAEMREVLAGVYPHLLESWGMASHLGPVLPVADIVWLLDPDAPGRRDTL